MVRRLLKALLPPVVLAIWRKTRPLEIGFSGDYVSWDTALAASGGYDTVEILNRVAAATRKVIAGEAIYERDSVIFDHIEYSWPLLASLLQVASERQSLRVVDFGGSLGSTWRQNRKFLRRLTVPLSWRVVEQKNFVELGKAEFSDEILSFDYTIGDASRSGADAILFCSSLCYVSDPAIFLAQALNADVPYLIIDRLPVISGNRDRISVQKVTEPIYPASYPLRLFAEGKLLNDWLRAWRLIERWECDLQPDPDARYCGFFLEKR